MWTPQSEHRVFVPVFLLLVAGAWLALVVWSASPGAYLLDHRNLGHTGVFPDSKSLATMAGFVAGWNLMVTAMMLPTIIPLLLILRKAAGSTHRLSVTVWAALGYVSVWSVFGAIAHGVDVVIHLGVESHTWLHTNAWILGFVPLALAGTYQFTPLKHLCLERCRSPFSFVASRWHGERPRLQAFRTGMDHGIFCLGCCWALMLLMFAISAGSLAWMLLLAAVMGIEKNVAWGHRLSIPAGVVLLSAAGTLAVMNV